MSHVPNNPSFNQIRNDFSQFNKSSMGRNKAGRNLKNKNKRRRSSTESESEETPVSSSDHEETIINNFEIPGDCVRMSLRKRKAPCYKDTLDAGLSGESGTECLDDNRSLDGGSNLNDNSLVPFQQKDLVEGEIAIIEKVLAVRPNKDLEASLCNPDNDKEFLVKYKYFSYLHCEWATLEALAKKDKRAIAKTRRFLSKSDPNSFMADEEYYNPDFVEIDRIVDKTVVEDPATNQKTTHYLVKWCSMAYEDSTWELEDDLCQSKIEEYNRLLHPKPEYHKFVPRPQPMQFFKLEQSPEYNDGNTLREYQLEGLNWLRFCWYNWQNCILADEMGLGKTIQTIAFLVEMKKFGIRGPFLIIAPLSTITNWQREFETWSDINAIVYHGSSRSRQIILQHEVFYFDEQNQRVPEIHKFEACITTYEMIICDKEFLYSLPWRCLVIDEAHRLKNRNCKLLEGLNQLRTEHRILLTGTPLQNNVEELFSLLSFLDPARTISPEAFLHEFGNLQSEGQLEKLQALLKPIMLRRLKEDVESNIAPKEETIIEVEMTLVQKRIYRAILERNFSFLANSGHNNSIPNLMNTMMELRKCCNHPFLINGCEEKILAEYRNEYQTVNETNLMAMIDSSGKLVLIDKLLKRLRTDGHKVLIFSQMVRVLDLLEDYLIAVKYPYERIDGHVRGYNRQAAIDRFSKNDLDRFVFLLCTRAGGLGINLTAADTVIIFDSDWNPQNDLQAQARCHRIGQKKAVKVYRLICRNSYEKEMFHRAGMKLGLDKAVLQTLNSSSKEIKPNQPTMTKKEIENLLRHGAYGALLEEDIEESSKFCAEDIDQILERRATTVKISGECAGSTFAKASFVSDRTRLDFDVDDPDFWSKWANNAKIDLKSAHSSNDLNIDFPRNRKQTQRFGNSKGMNSSSTNDNNNNTDNNNNNNNDDNDDDDDIMSGRTSDNEYRQKVTSWNIDQSTCAHNLLLKFGFGDWTFMKDYAWNVFGCHFGSVNELRRCCTAITVWAWHRLRVKPFILDIIERILVKNQRSTRRSSRSSRSTRHTVHSSSDQSDECNTRSSTHKTSHHNHQHHHHQHHHHHHQISTRSSKKRESKNNKDKDSICVHDCLHNVDFRQVSPNHLIVNRQYRSLLKNIGRQLLISIFNVDVIRQIFLVSNPDGWSSTPSNSNFNSYPANLFERRLFFNDLSNIHLKLPSDIPSLTLNSHTNSGMIEWWNDSCDQHLILGLYIHGHDSYDSMIDDSRLVFKQYLQPSTDINNSDVNNIKNDDYSDNGKNNHNVLTKSNQETVDDDVSNHLINNTNNNNNNNNDNNDNNDDDDDMMQQSKMNDIKDNLENVLVIDNNPDNKKIDTDNNNNDNNDNNNNNDNKDKDDNNNDNDDDDNGQDRDQDQALALAQVVQPLASEDLTYIYQGFDSRLKQIIMGFCRHKRKKEQTTTLSNDMSGKKPPNDSTSSLTSTAASSLTSTALRNRELMGFYKGFVLFGLVSKEQAGIVEGTLTTTTATTMTTMTTTYGSTSPSLYDWTLYRMFNEDFKFKNDSQMMDLWINIKNKCTKVVNSCSNSTAINPNEDKSNNQTQQQQQQQQPIGVSTGASVTTPTTKITIKAFFQYKRASKLLDRMQFFNQLRHFANNTGLDDLINNKDCPALDEHLAFPKWWQIGLNDYDLVIGVSRHGLNHPNNDILNDQELSFYRIVQESINEDRTASDSNPTTAETESNRMSGKSSSQVAVDKSVQFDQLSQSIGWPKNKSIVQRLNRIISWLDRNDGNVSNTESLSLSPSNQAHHTTTTQHFLPPVSPSSN